MNTLGSRFIKAQTIANNVLMMKKNRFLESIGLKLNITNEAYVPRIVQWNRLCGFRFNGSEKQEIASLQNGVGEWIRKSIRSGNAAVYSIKAENDSLSVLYGSGRYGAENCFHSNLPECQLSKTDWGNTNYNITGILTGTICSENLADAIAVSNIHNCFVACIIVPISDEEVQEKIQKNRELISFLDSHKSFQRVYGNATRRVEEISIDTVVNAIALLKEENDYLLRHQGSGFVRTAVKFGSQSESDFRSLSSIILSSISTVETEAFEPNRIYRINGESHSISDCLSVPCVDVLLNNLSERVYTVSLQDLQGAIAFCTPPVNSYKGYYIKNYSINEESKDAFPQIPPIVERGVDIGKIVSNSSVGAVIPMNSLRSHMFVTGATDSGKTTTVKKTLVELYNKGIPFTVVEAAKKEYISLLENIPELRIYTAGTDGVLLSINPLQPEEGVLIEKHVDALVRSLVVATGGEHPIPEAFDGLLKQTYRQFGWNYGMMAYYDPNQPFPTFKDVFNNIDSYIEKHAQYGPEVKKNLTAALTLRTENMYDGAMGTMFSQSFGLQSKDLLETPCVIELADFSATSAAFLMNILLFKFQTYLSRMPESTKLKRVIVVEEAHNIFKKTLDENSARALNNDYFEKMLAEIRSSGTGLILSDQRPCAMSEAVIANTSVKIIHSLVDYEDRRVVGIPANLTDFQLKKISEFKTGECIISLRGYHGVQHVQINKAMKTREYNSACHVCTCRFKCRKMAVKKMIQTMDSSSVSMHMSKIQSNPYNARVVENNISNMLKDLNVISADSTKICLLGELLDIYGHSSEQEKRTIVNSFVDFIRRR